MTDDPIPIPTPTPNTEHRPPFPSMYFDSHMHFDKFEAKGETGALLERAAIAGVGTLIAVGGSDEANQLARRLAGQHPGRIYASAGYDRDEVGSELDLQALDALLADPEVVAVGETGLDYHYGAEKAPEQRALLEQMLGAAAASAKPVIIHSREAEDDTLAMLENYVSGLKASRERPGVLHCFTGNRAFAEQLVAMGFYISFSGILTFKNAEAIREAAVAVPLDRILVETDAPYLAPVPHRGRRNEPAFVVEVARRLAELRQLTLEETAAHTTENARRLFGIRA